MEHRSRNGGRWAETRDDPKKLHPDMLPYTKLPEGEKGKDRNTIRHYPDFAARVGYRIVPIGCRRATTPYCYLGKFLIQHRMAKRPQLCNRLRSG